MITGETIPLMGYRVFSGEKLLFADGARGVICTLNPHSYVLARRDPLFREALQGADFLIPDGVGIKIAAKILEHEKIDRIAGSDLHEIVLASLNQRHGSCFYLGSTDETLQKIRERIAAEYPHVRMASYSPPYREVFSEKENTDMLSAVDSFSPDVLFVGMTAPKQEKWVHENRNRLNVPLVCSIGAVFDFYAGTVKRSGAVWRKMGLEWLPRLLREPRRLWRRNFISTPLFLWYVCVNKVKKIFRLT
jgi:N-acetylglucosaminyldiphosphoundecaprenol N-acetyl-beta-D-mannosaminyltransferase